METVKICKKCHCVNGTHMDDHFQKMSEEERHKGVKYLPEELCSCCKVEKETTEKVETE